MQLADRGDTISGGGIKKQPALNKQKQESFGVQTARTCPDRGFRGVGFAKIFLIWMGEIMVTPCYH